MTPRLTLCREHGHVYVAQLLALVTFLVIAQGRHTRVLAKYFLLTGKALTPIELLHWAINPWELP